MPRDPFDDFAAEMNRRTTEQLVQDAAERIVKAKSGLTEQQMRDRAVLSAMKDMPLARGQMLLLGPKSVAMLSGAVPYGGSLPDKLILDRSEWCPNRT